MRISPLAALFLLLLPEANLAQNLDDFKEALSSIPPGDVNDPLKSFSTGVLPADILYKTYNDNEVCPAFQDDMGNFLDSLLLLSQGYPKFFEPRAFPNGAVFGPGTCTTSYISHEQIRKKLNDFPKLFEEKEVYRENSLGLLRLNDLIFKKGVWSDDYAGIVIGAPKEDHDIYRPVVDYLFGDAIAPTRKMSESPEPFNGDGNTWSSDDFYRSAIDYLSGKDEVTVGADASAWVIKTFHEQIFNLSLSTEELQLFNTLQGVFVLLSSINPKTIELLYPVLNNLLSSLAQDSMPIALGQLSRRLSDATTDRAESTEDNNQSMEMSAIIGNLQNAMQAIQFMANMGDIGDLNIAEDLISILFKILNATKDAYATLYSLAIANGNLGGMGSRRTEHGPGPSTMTHVRNLLGNNAEHIIKAGHAVADAFFFAGGLSVPSVIEATAGVYFGNAIEVDGSETFDIQDEMKIKLLVLEATRRFPPVLGVTYIDRETGQRIAPLPGMAGFDKEEYGEDVMKIKIRGDLQYYHEKSLNFAEAAGPLMDKPHTSRICPGRSMSIAMATQFIRAMKLGDYCLAEGEKIVFDDGGPTYFNAFTVTKTACDAAPPVRPPPGPPATVDNPSFEFVLPHNGSMENCAWLLAAGPESDDKSKKKSMKNTVKKRLKQFCDMYVRFEEVTEQIKYFCPVSCEDDSSGDAAGAAIRGRRHQQ